VKRNLAVNHMKLTFKDLNGRKIFFEVMHSDLVNNYTIRLVVSMLLNYLCFKHLLLEVQELFSKKDRLLTKISWRNITPQSHGQSSIMLTANNWCKYTFFYKNTRLIFCSKFKNN